MHNVLVVFSTLCTLCSMLCTFSYADTIYTNDGQETRGIIIEDYKDRVVMSTIDGEVTLLKSDIKQLFYDSEADNLVKLAEQSRERGDMIKAFAYYDMALRSDPNSKAAKNGIIFLQGYLFRKEQVKKEDEVKKREEFENFGAARISEEKTTQEKTAEMTAVMLKVLGIALSEKEGKQIINRVRMNSPAEEAGVIRGDTIVAVWGRLTRYMPLGEVMEALLEKSSMEIKCTIERSVAVPVTPDRPIMASLKDMIGATFRMEFDGLTVSDVTSNSPALEAGLAKGDIIVEIGNKSVLYTPLNKAVAMMRNSRGGVILLKIRRDLLIWRKT